MLEMNEENDVTPTISSLSAQQVVAEDVKVCIVIWNMISDKSISNNFHFP